MNKDLFINQINKNQTLLSQLNQNPNWSKNYKLLEDLINYDAYFNSLITLCNFISKQPITFKCDDKRFENIVNESIQNINFQDFVNLFLNYLSYGYVVFEVIYKKSGADDIVTVSELSFIDYNFSILFQEDDDGSLYSIRVGNTELNYLKFQNASFNSKKNKYYGNSILTKDIANTIMYARDALLNLNIANYRFGNPLFVTKTDSFKNKNRLKEAFKNVKDGLTSIFISTDEEVTTVQSNHNEDNFIKSIELYDKKIAKSLFIGDMLYGGSNSKGSYNQGEIQLTMLYANLDSIIKDIEEFWIEIIKKLYLINISPDLEKFHGLHADFSIVKFSDTDSLNIQSIEKDLVV
ncbi:MAG: hypothetical protein LBC39_02640 [Methanobrevibacter sp.]|jgi:hypothetical protein|nr:hypothetical protein [Candidatus Methanovirga aequatorialis]